MLGWDIPVQQMKEGPAWCKLGDDGQIWRRGAGSHEHDHIRMFQTLAKLHLRPEFLHQVGNICKKKHLRKISGPEV